MNHLTELRKRLELAESAYKTANSCLDGGSLEFILAKEELKQCRFKYGKACEIVVNSILDDPFLMQYVERKWESKPEKVWCKECQNHVDPSSPACECDFIVNKLKEQEVV